MVYENIFREKREIYLRSDDIDQGTVSTTPKDKATDDKDENERNDEISNDEKIPHPSLREQHDLGRKAYGSNHIAAILAKKDFTLWVKAGDVAVDIAHVHEDIMKLPNLTEELRTYHKAERRRWKDEALRDYKSADNLKPPGIDVPAKLASMHLELGSLSEALTILTGLKSNHEFQKSYTAWLLYSDLMLRLGHECIQWNKKMYTNDNYMFRRWLRKHSVTFDWQERRLQALTLAFEAAAGTICTEQFVEWIRRRTAEGTKTSENNNNTDSLTGNEQKIDDKGMGSERAKQLEADRTILLNEQSREMQEFDTTTNEMAIDTKSDAARNRADARDKLAQSHAKAITTLERDYNPEEKAADNDAEKDEIVSPDRVILPMAASLGRVCSIASDLEKQLLGLELFEGARLVAESVIRYMKERARHTEIRLKEKERAEEWRQKISRDPLFLETNDENDNIDDSDIPYLSDDEIILDHGPDMLHSLRVGSLTPELSVLFGLALIGKGGRNFIAARNLQSIDNLEIETKEWLSEGDEDAKLGGDESWHLFRRAMTEELGRTSAYSFLADVLRKTGKEFEWAAHFAPFFHKHVEILKENGIVDELLALDTSTLSPSGNVRRNQVLKVIIASCKYDVLSIDQTNGAKPALGTTRQELDETARIKIAQSALEMISQVVPLVWTVENDGILSPINIEVRFLFVYSLRSSCHVVADLRVSFTACQNLFHVYQLAIVYLREVIVLCFKGRPGKMRYNYIVSRGKFNSRSWRCQRRKDESYFRKGWISIGFILATE